MLDLNKLMLVDTVVVHDNCPDGMASAILLKDAFYGRQVEFLFVQHNTDVHKNLSPRPNVLFADFVPYAETEPVPGDERKRQLTEAGRHTIQQWVDAGAYVLDHHKTAKDLGIIDMFLQAGQCVFGDEVANPGVCGAVLSYEHVWKPLRGDLAIQNIFAAEFARLAGIRDTWQKTSPDFREASLQAAVLGFFPRERWLGTTLTDLASRWKSEFRPIGEVLMEKQEKSVKGVLEKAYHFTTAKGTRVVCFDGIKKSSDAAEVVGDTADLVIGFGYLSEPGNTAHMTQDSLDRVIAEFGGLLIPRMILSTRSHTTYNCSALASYYGGGGHTKAAGFNRTLKQSDPQPFEMIRQLVEAFENHE